MKIATFHLNLLGKDRSRTPEKFWLTERHKELYEGFEKSDLRGYENDDEDEELFLGTLVLALSQTKMGTAGVVLIVPSDKTNWVLTQTRAVARHIFSLRKRELTAVRVLRAAFKQLQVTSHESFQQVPEPRMWLLFGYGRHTPMTVPMAPWMTGRTLPDVLYLSDFS